MTEATVGDPNESDFLVYWAQTTLWPLYERTPRAVVWCPRWWEHPEALFRIELIHRAWEIAVTSENPQALSDWVLHTADPHVGVLLSPSGPFADCSWNERNGYKHPHQPRPLPQTWPEDFDYSQFPAVSPPEQQAS